MLFARDGWEGRDFMEPAKVLCSGVRVDLREVWAGHPWRVEGPYRREMPGPIHLTRNLFVDEGNLWFAFTSSGGPGGQNVNKRATKAQLRVRIADLPLTPVQAARLIANAGSLVVGQEAESELLISADEFRSQGRNRDACIERLRELVAECCVAPKVRRPTKPSRGSKERRLNEKKITGERKRTRRGEW